MTGAGPEPIQMGRGKPGWRSRLTPRLRRVAALLADGYTNEAIARRLGLEAGAVRKDVVALYRLAGLEARDAEHNPRVVLAVRLQNAMARERERERRAQRDQRQPAATGMEGGEGDGMRIGTKSLLFGAHQVCIHPWFVAAAWTKLYGFPRDPRLWLAFVIHDWGYWGKPNMDGPEGEEHVLWAARVMLRLFGWDWYWFCLQHSRFYAKKWDMPFSRLCVADKLAIALTPAWLYLPLVRLSGEIDEYMALAKARTAAGEPKYASMKLTTSDETRWYADVQEYLRRWVEEHKDGRADTWTPSGAQGVTA